MKYILVFFIIISGSRLYAQGFEIKKFADSITATHLSKYITRLASDEMEGRKTGMMGGKKAAAYIGGEFEKAGLNAPSITDGYFQKLAFYKDTIMPVLFKIGNQKFDFGKDYVITTGNSGQNEFAAKQIIFCGYGINDSSYNDYNHKNVEGKVVVIFPDEPQMGGRFLINKQNYFSEWSQSISGKILEANKRRAAAVLLVNPGNDLAISTQAAQPSASFDSLHREFLRIPVITIVPDLLKKIFSYNEAQKMLEVHHNRLLLNDLNFQNHLKIKLAYGQQRILGSSENVIGYIEGREHKNQFVIISAHYDHIGKKDKDIYYGADDNASGVAALLEIANTFKIAARQGFTPESSIVFIAFTGEEAGLWGSEFYTNHPLFSLDSTRIDLNIDMIGRIEDDAPHSKDGTYLYLIGTNQLSSELPSIIKNEKNKDSLVSPSYKYQDPKNEEYLFYRSDHYNFAKKGVPVIFFTSGLHKDYHQLTDTVDKINFNALEKRTRFIFKLATDFAGLPSLPKRDLPLPPEM